jgi:type IV pilus assembly protein PilV
MRITNKSADMKKHNPSISGFTLLEVLITLIVVAIGLLGVAGLQVSAIKLADIAESRTKGSVFTEEIMSRIRANKAQALAYDTNGYTTVSADGTLPKQDLVEWQAAIAKLPEGKGSVQIRRIGGDCSGSAAAVTIDYCSSFDAVVRLRWNEGRARGGDTQREFSASTRI